MCVCRWVAGRRGRGREEAKWLAMCHLFHRIMGVHAPDLFFVYVWKFPEQKLFKSCWFYLLGYTSMRPPISLSTSGHPYILCGSCTGPCSFLGSCACSHFHILNQTISWTTNTSLLKFYPLLTCLAQIPSFKKPFWTSPVHNSFLSPTLIIP